MESFDPTKGPGKPTGRKSKLTPELMAKIVELVKAGNYIEVACAACGVSDRSYYTWLANARDVITAHGEDLEEWPADVTEHQVMCFRFYQAMKLAQAESEAYAVATVRKAMSSNWTAAMTYLERRYPGRWKRRDEHVVGSPFEVAGANARSGVDEAALLNDPEAVRLLHEAMMHVAAAKPEDAVKVIEATAHVEDAEVVDPDSTG